MGRPLNPLSISTVTYLNYEVLDDSGWDLDDDGLFEQVTGTSLDAEGYDEMEVNQGEYILEVAEAQGYDWPFSCRVGVCANCAVIVKEGEIDMDMQRIFSDEEINGENVCLICIGLPVEDEVKTVCSVKYLDYLQSRVIQGAHPHISSDAPTRDRWVYHTSAQ